MKSDMDLRKFRKKHALILAPGLDNDLLGSVSAQLRELSLIGYRKDLTPYDTITLLLPAVYSGNPRIMEFAARDQILPSTLTSLDKALEVMQNTTDQDLCHIIVCGHGSLEPDHVIGEIPPDSDMDHCIWLPNDLDTTKIYESSLRFSDGVLTSSALKSKISAMPATILFITGQCYGANFAYNLLRRQDDTAMSGSMINSIDLGVHFISKIPNFLYSHPPVRRAFLEPYLVGYDASYLPQYFVHDGQSVSVFNCSNIPRE